MKYIEFDNKKLDEIFYDIAPYMKDVWQDFLSKKDNIKLLNENKFVDLYHAWQVSYKRLPNELTIILLKSGIDFLPYMDRIVNRMFGSLPLIHINLEALPNINKIGTASFENTLLKEITIPTWIEEIGVYPFFECLDLHEINYSDEASKLYYMIEESPYSTKPETLSEKLGLKGFKNVRINTKG